LVAALAMGLGACSGSLEGDGQDDTTPLAGAGAGPLAGTAAAGAGAATAGSAGPLGGTGAAGAGAGAGGGAGGTGVLACERQMIEPRAVLLTPQQYVNALSDLLGPDSVTEMQIADNAGTEFDVLDRAWVTTSTLDRTLRLAETATETLRGEVTTLLGCTALTDRACVRSGLERIALRAFKRPAEATELDALMAIYDAGRTALPDDAGESATLHALQAILIAPSTLYRTEFLGPASAGTRPLTAYERAAALGFLLLDSVPDDGLMAAAESGALMTPEGVRAEVRRLIALPRVRDHITALVIEAYRVSKLFETSKDTMVFPEYTGSLALSMYEESERFIEDILWNRGGPISELMTSDTSFVNAELANLYGIPYTGTGDEFVEATLPASRRGLLTQASVLTVLSRTDETSVVARGLFVRTAMLCLPKVGAPPESVQQQVMEQVASDASEKELAERRAMTSPCLSCHLQFDRFGLLLENFDAIGREGAPLTEPIDLMGLGPLEGTITNASELADLIAEDDRFNRCFAERLLDYGLTMVQGGDPFCDTDPLHQVAAGATITDVLEAVTTHPAFLSRAEGSP
jgi:hypothetical protein